MVVLMEENKEAAEIYMLTRGQVITRMVMDNMCVRTQIIDINIQAIKSAMDIMGTRNPKECLLKVEKTFHHFLKEDA